MAHGLVERISTGGRAAYFGLAPNEHHRPHPHFYCKRCGQMECLNPESLTLDSDAFGKTFPGPDRQGGSSPGRHLQELHALKGQGPLFPARVTKAGGHLIDAYRHDRHTPEPWKI